MKKIITAIIATLCMSLISSCTIEYDQTSYWVKCEMGFVGVEDNPITVSVTTPDGQKDYNIDGGWYLGRTCHSRLFSEQWAAYRLEPRTELRQFRPCGGRGISASVCLQFCHIFGNSAGDDGFQCFRKRYHGPQLSFSEARLYFLGRGII